MNNAQFRRRTPLLFAAYGGSPEIISMLFEKGINISRLDQNSEILQACLASKSVKCLKILLEKGISPSAYEGVQSVLMRAISSDLSFEAIGALIEIGDDPNYTNSLGECPLYLAICNRKVNIVTLLLEKGTHPFFQGPNGNGTFHTCCSVASLPLLQLFHSILRDSSLYDNVNYVEYNDFGMPMLFSTLKALTNPNAVDDVIDTLYYIFHNNDFPIDINMTDLNGKTTLLYEYIKRREQYPKLTEFLLKEGAQMDFIVEIEKPKREKKSIYQIVMESADPQTKEYFSKFRLSQFSKLPPPPSFKKKKI